MGIYNLLTPKNTGSGVADFALLAPVADFAVDGIKCPVAPFTNPGDEVLVDTDHVFLANKGFAKFALAPEKNKLESKTIGDKGFSKFEHTATIVVPGSYAEVHEVVKNLLNTPLVALIKDSNCAEDIYYQLGCDCVYAYITADFQTGTTADGIKGYTLTITYRSESVLLHKPTTLDVLA